MLTASLRAGLTTSAGLAVLAAALLCWPTRTARARLAGIGRPSAGGLADPAAAPGQVPANQPGTLLRWTRRPGPAVAAVAGAVLGFAVAGPGGAVAFGTAATTGLAAWRARRDGASRFAATAEFATALGLLAAELRAGVHPAVAAERAVSGAGSAVSRALGSVAAAARLSGDIAGALHRAAKGMPALTAPLRRLATAWTLAERHGIGLAEVVDAVRTDVDHQVRATGRLTAALAGPRATAAVLAALPLVGLLLGQAVGAAPWRVLTGTAAGQLLLAVGSLLLCAGVGWSARLVRGAGGGHTKEGRP